MRKSRKNTRQRQRQKHGNRKTRKTTAKGHSHEDLPHYHLLIKLPNQKIKEIPEKFLRSNRDRNIRSATVQDIINYVIYYTEYDEGAFHIFWKNKKLKPTTKLRHIKVHGEKLPLYHPNFDDKLEVRLTDDGSSTHSEIIESPQTE